MDKKRGIINIRIQDVGDFIQVASRTTEGESPPETCPIFSTGFYRTDASRNSSKGGSGIGLSIVKKILRITGEESGPPVRKESGRKYILSLRKYQEVIQE